jgi:hypothetical protein
MGSFTSPDIRIKSRYQIEGITSQPPKSLNRPSKILENFQRAQKIQKICGMTKARS